MTHRLAKPDGRRAFADAGKVEAADRARSKQPPVPVLRGSEPWKAWVESGHKDSLYSTVRLADGRSAPGWYFPSLYPREIGCRAMAPHARAAVVDVAHG